MEFSRIRGVIMKTDSMNVRSVDGLEDAGVSVELADSCTTRAWIVRLVADDGAWPRQSSLLDPRAARTLARYLLELADEAELLNMEAEDVEMACTECKKPVRKAFGASIWAHRDPGGVLGCTASPVKAMVAAGA
jgi:hypothetical protein